MLLRSKRRCAGTSSRPGVSLLEVLVAIAIMTVVSAMILVGVATSRSGGGAARVDKAVLVLAKLGDASVRYAGLNNKDSSFTQRIGGPAGGVNPGKLSQLTTKIVSGVDKNSCGSTYTSGEAALWTRVFYFQPVPTAGFKVSDGFYANDALVRYNVAGTPTVIAGTDFTTPGTLAIVMPNVSLEDAEALAARVEGDQKGVIGAVRFTPNGNAPVTVYYHWNIHGC